MVYASSFNPNTMYGLGLLVGSYHKYIDSANSNIYSPQNLTTYTK